MTQHDENQHEPIAISERQLTQMTTHLEEAHQATLPVMHRAVAEWDDRLRSENTPDDLAEMRAKFGRPSRRGFLIGAGATLGGLVLAACSSDDDSTSSGSSSSNTKASANSALATDLKIAALATALENTAVATYQAGIDAATTGKLGTVPPAIVTFATTAQQQHKDHAQRGTRSSPVPASPRWTESTSPSTTDWCNRSSRRSPSSPGWPSSHWRWRTPRLRPT